MRKTIVAAFVGSLLAASTIAAQTKTDGATADKEVVLRIAALPLDVALKEFGRQSGLHVVMYSEVARGVTSHGVSGKLTTNAALQTLLEGSGLRFEFLDDRTVKVWAATNPHAEGTRDEKEEGEHPLALAQSRPREDQAVATSEAQAVAQEGNRRGPSETVGIGEVVVTGTRIRGTAAPVGAPLLTLDRLEIERRGYTSTEELVQSIQQNFRGGAAGATADANFSSGSKSGFNISYGSGVNLRGLGATATLVLVNGHRIASSGSGNFTDISTIPVSAIERIDVLTDGASAIYGSDAIGGVINIILKTQSAGVEVGVRGGTSSSDGYSSFGATLEIGNTWDLWGGGEAILVGDFTSQSALLADERTFTQDVTSPTSVFPSLDQIAVIAAARQTLNSRIALHADVEYADVDKTAFLSIPPPVAQTYRNVPSVERWSGSTGATFKIADALSLRYDFSSGRETTDFQAYLANLGAPESFDSELVTISKFADHTLSLSADLFQLPGGTVRAAAGGGYRTEDFHSAERTTATTTATDVDRNVTAGYAELSVPLVGEKNAFPGLRALTLSAAVRHDRYSDFGNTTNPKYGLSWYPIESLQVRAAYSTSFRAPATGAELIQSQNGLTAGVVRPFPNAGGGAPVPVLFIVGGQPGLEPETAESAIAGFDYKSSKIPGLSLSVSYYDISYDDQLNTPPFSFNPLNDPALASVITRFPDSGPVVALVNEARANGRPILDITRGQFGPNPINSTVFIYDSRTANLSSVKTSGYDMSAIYSRPLGSSTAELRLDGTYIDKFVTAVTRGSPEIDQVDSVGFPAKLRLRGQASWKHKALSVSVASNYVGSYPDSSAATARNVGSYTTFDVVARYDSPAVHPLLTGVRASIVVTNIFDRSPPYVESGSARGRASGFHYDPANADPCGRFLSLAIQKRW